MESCLLSMAEKSEINDHRQSKWLTADGSPLTLQRMRSALLWADGIALAPEVPVRCETSAFPLDAANDAVSAIAATNALAATTLVIDVISLLLLLEHTLAELPRRQPTLRRVR
jgi:hypothetical protein